MKKVALAFSVLAALPLAAAADVSKEDVKKLVAAGIGEDVILTFIRANGPVQKLSADDVVELKQAGATEKVLGALMGGASRPAPATQVVEKPVYVPQTTYVYSTPTYAGSYYYPSSYYYGYWGPSYYYYPRTYSGYCGPVYRGYYGYAGYRYCAPRVGVSIGWRW
jgi:hypothetical protein